MNLIFATNNLHKLEEIRAAAPKQYHISGLKDAGIIEEIPETMDTLEGNAIEKANYIFKKYSLPCFADDTGLEVQALNNRPGILSARYAGPHGNSGKNIEKLLKEMTGIEYRNARFRTIIAFINNKIIETFEGVVEGKIALKEAGENGFGYDPVFIPFGSHKTFAEMTIDEKKRISHRSIALNKFIDFLRDFSDRQLFETNL
ncbi:MAG: RdgB/HAM1 family non-canonical purine NTP pyrophosphatase [Bacteroidales bacterium]|nr:RdgB/HAM1 family non-canonical purine NTP pyrophosphatase [Bacteroidales bacterium]